MKTLILAYAHSLLALGIIGPNMLPQACTSLVYIVLILTAGTLIGIVLLRPHGRNK